MSKRPAIGRKYYNDHVLDILETDELIMKTVKGNVGSNKPPKYFDRLNKETYPEFMEFITEERRHAAERTNKAIQRATNISDKELYEREAERLLTKANMLKRINTEQERLHKI